MNTQTRINVETDSINFSKTNMALLFLNIVIQSNDPFRTFNRYIWFSAKTFSFFSYIYFYGESFSYIFYISVWFYYPFQFAYKYTMSLIGHFHIFFYKINKNYNKIRKFVIWSVFIRFGAIINLKKYHSHLDIARSQIFVRSALWTWIFSVWNYYPNCQTSRSRH